MTRAAKAKGLSGFRQAVSFFANPDNFLFGFASPYRSRYNSWRSCRGFLEFVLGDTMSWPDVRNISTITLPIGHLCPARF